MSIKYTKATIQTDNYLELEDLHERMESRLIEYSKKHKDFSVLFEKHINDNTLVIKTLYLDEHIN